MTRINSGISPKELPNKVLYGELFEITRIVKYANKASKNAVIPKNFCLGKGHVTFFYDKGLYTLNRYKALREEAISRGSDVVDLSYKWESYPKKWMNDWMECENCRSIILKRFEEKGHVLI